MKGVDGHTTHSRTVKRLAFTHALSPVCRGASVIHTPVLKHANPYVLPWDLHALMTSQPLQRTHPQLLDELLALKEEFRDWRPSGAHGGEEIRKLKLRLQALSAKL